MNTFAGLAAKRVPIAIVDHATRGNPESSPRYRDLLLPSDILHELRAAFVIRGRVWGAVHIARRASSGPFQQPDAEALGAITGAIARGIRTSLRFDAAQRISGLEAPGLVVLGAGDEVEMITPPARELLASIAASDIPYADNDMPTAVLSLAGFVRSAPILDQRLARVTALLPFPDEPVSDLRRRTSFARKAKLALRANARTCIVADSTLSPPLLLPAACRCEPSAGHPI